MTTATLTLPANRRSYIHIPRRDLVLSGGDDLTFAVSLVEADRPDAEKIELRGVASALYLTVWHCSTAWDYGAWRLMTYRPPVVRSVQAVADVTTLGLCRFTLPRGALADHGRRLSYSIAYDDGDMRDLCWGHMHVRWSPVRGLPNATSALLNDDYTPILDDNYLPIEV